MTRLENSLLIATGNRGKVREMMELFASLPVNFLSLPDFPEIEEVEESGSTFVENARLKAVGYARQTGCLSLADDSGIEITALNGAPGVLSARYGGDAASFAEKMELVLAEMKLAPRGGRQARFVCAIALADSNGAVLAVSEGECRGTIADRPRGDGGFGYDPIFVPDGFDRTFGELPGHIKQQFSHRARAVEKIIPYLLDFTGTST